LSRDLIFIVLYNLYLIFLISIHSIDYWTIIERNLARETKQTIRKGKREKVAKYRPCLDTLAGLELDLVSNSSSSSSSRGVWMKGLE
jgi:hypothetical protein